MWLESHIKAWAGPCEGFLPDAEDEKWNQGCFCIKGSTWRLQPSSLWPSLASSQRVGATTVASSSPVKAAAKPRRRQRPSQPSSSSRILSSSRYIDYKRLHRGAQMISTKLLPWAHDQATAPPLPKAEKSAHLLPQHQGRGNHIHSQAVYHIRSTEFGLIFKNLFLIHNFLWRKTSAF